MEARGSTDVQFVRCTREEGGSLFPSGQLKIEKLYQRENL